MTNQYRTTQNRRSPLGEYIHTLSKNPENWGKFTRAEIAEMATRECGFAVDVEKVRSVLRVQGIKDFTRPANGKMREDSQKGDATMAQFLNTRTETAEDFDRFAAFCKEQGVPVDDVAYYWFKTQEYSCFIKRPEIQSFEDMRRATIDEMKSYAPHYQRRATKPPGDNLMVIPQADVHIGKWCDYPETGNVYNTEQAVNRCRDGTDALVSKAMAFGVKAFVLCVGNDILHIDTPKRTSTAGTPQDTDGTIFTMYQAAKKLYITMIEQLALVADVHLVFVPSNHDWVSGYMLADSVGSWFSKHPNVHLGEEWQNLYARHRKYVHFGHNLIMFTHGDGAKEKDLHWHLATEAAEVWSKTRFRYVYTGHIHHKVRKVKGYGDAQIEKDYVGFTEISGFDREPTRNVHIEYVRSQSPADGWHDRNGYTNIPACEAFLHHPTEGQFARFTHYY